MSSALGTLVASVVLDVAQFSEGTTKAGYLAAQMASNVDRAMKEMEYSVKTAITSIAGVLGVGLSADYFVGLVKGSIDALDHLQNLTKSTNLTVSTLSGLKLLAASSGTDLDSMAMAIDRMSVNMGKSPEKFQALGVTAKDTSKAFQQLSDIFNSLTDIQQRNALAQAVFGKSWAEMAPALSKGGDQIGELIAKGKELSGVTDESAKEANKFTEQQAILTTTLGATKTKLVSDLLPALNDAAKAMSEAAKQGGLWAAALAAGQSALEHLLSMDEASKLKDANIWLAQQIALLRAGNLSYEAQARVIAEISRLEKERELHTPPPAMVAAAIDPAAAAKSAAAAAAFLQTNKDEKDSYDALIRAIDERIAVGQTELDSTVKLTAAQQFIAKTIAGMDDATHKLSAAHRDNALAALDEVAAIDAESRSRESASAAAEGYYKILDEIDTLHQKSIETTAKLVEKMADENEKLAFETTLIGKTKEQQALLNIEFERTIALRGKTNPLERDAINNAFDLKVALVAQGDALKAQTSLWTDASAKAGQFFGDLIMNGKSAFDRLRTELKSFLQELIALFAQKWVLSVAGSLMAGTASGASLTSAAGSVGANSISGAFTSVAGSAVGAGLDAAGGALYGAGATALGANVSTLGVAMQGGAAAVGGFSEVLAAAVPVIGWVVAIGAVLYGIFGTGGKGGPKTGGYSGSTFDAAGALTGSMAAPGTDNGRYFTPSQMDAQLQTITAGFGKVYTQTIAALGGTAKGFSFLLGADNDPNGSAQSRVSSGLLSASGQSLYSNVNQSMDDKSVPAALQLEASRALLVALQSSDLPAYLAKAFDGLTASTATQQQITDAMSMASALKSIFDVVSKNPMKDIAAAMDAQLNPLAAALKNNATAIGLVMTAYNGSLATTQNLATATTAYYNAQLQLISGIYQAKSAIDDMFGATFRNIKLAGMDTQAKYNFYQSDAATAQAQALSSSDPATIQRLATQINADINAAFALLSPADQAGATGAAFLSRGQATQSAIDARLEKIAKDTADATQKTLDAIKTLIGAGADAQTAAAASQVVAGTLQVQAATTPRTLTVVIPGSGQQVVTFG